MVNHWQQLAGAEGLPGRRKVGRAATVIQIAFPMDSFLTLQSSWLFSPALWALLSEMLQLYFQYCSGIASLSLDWAQIRKDSLSFYLAWASNLTNPVSLGGSNIPKSSLSLLPQPKSSNSHSPYLDRRASQMRWGKCWWHFIMCLSPGGLSVWDIPIVRRLAWDRWLRLWCQEDQLVLDWVHTCTFLAV